MKIFVYFKQNIIFFIFLLILCISFKAMDYDKRLELIKTNEFIEKIHQKKEQDIVSLKYDKEKGIVKYDQRDIEKLKDNGLLWPFYKKKEYYYKLHKKKFMIPFYIYDFVPIKKIPKDNDGFYIIRFDQKLREICKRKLDYNKHHFDILSYLACHEYELENFMDMKYGDIYSQINDTFSEFVKNLNNNKYLIDDEIYVKLPPGSNAPLIFKGIQIKYNLYKIYNTKINDKYSKNEINSSKFITLVEDNEYKLVAVPDLEGLSYIYHECFIDNNFKIIPRNFINYPNSIFMFYQKYMKDTDLKTIMNIDDIKDIVESDKVKQNNNIPKCNDLD